MLIGISLGPGDPGLLTLKAVEALRSSSKVFVPGVMAADLARAYCKPEILDFPMIGDEAKLEKIWSKNADIVAGYAATTLTGFACIGDINTFSTFTHLKRLMNQKYPNVEMDTTPGVGIVPALASRFGIGLDRSFQVSDGSDQEAVIRIKAVQPRKIAQALEEKGFGQFILGTKLYTAEEEIVRAEVAGEMPERSDYFSVLYARKVR
ncbi:Tetrapyrrole (Corrin/Porphyrin) Methylases [uncultured archaeon]|nr:Tetrapyrrole (Corrin/Porphyrin) Methylases [uncultured archaeon]